MPEKGRTGSFLAPFSGKTKTALAGGKCSVCEMNVEVRYNAEGPRVQGGTRERRNQMCSA